MMNQYSQTQQISTVPGILYLLTSRICAEIKVWKSGGAVPPCGQTPFYLKYNVEYVYPPPKSGCVSALLFFALNLWLWVFLI